MEIKILNRNSRPDGNPVHYKAIICIGVYLIIYPFLFAVDYLLPYIPYSIPISEESTASADFNYANLYSISSPDSPDGFADLISYHFSYGIPTKKPTFNVSYRKQQFRAKLQALSNQDDWIKFTSLSEQLNVSGQWQIKQHLLNCSVLLGDDLGFTAGYTHKGKFDYLAGLGSTMGASDLDYDINGIRGRIPFNWYNLSARLGVQKGDDFVTLRYLNTLPGKSQNGFANNLYLNNLELSFAGKLPHKLSVKNNTSVQHSYIDLQYNNELYGKLENLFLLYSNLYVTRQASTAISYSLGSRFFMSRIGTDSYFDIWPFTYWDMFLAHRTRLKEADITSLIPYLSLTLEKDINTGGQPLKLKVAPEYNQFFHQESIIVKNRRVVMYPFFFTYDTDYYDFHKAPDGFFIIPLNVSYQRWGCDFGMALEQIIPIEWDFFTHKQSTHPSQAGNKTNQTGGTSFRFYFNLPTP